MINYFERIKGVHKPYLNENGSITRIRKDILNIVFYSICLNMNRDTERLKYV